MAHFLILLVFFLEISSSQGIKLPLWSLRKFNTTGISSMHFNEDVGGYVTVITFGSLTNMHSQLMNFDSGSDICWVPIRSYKRRQQALSCQSQICKNIFRGDCDSANRCKFDVAYDRGNARGIIIEDSVILPGARTGQDFVPQNHFYFGFAQSQQGLTAGVGVLGMNRGSSSFISQFRDALGGNVFSFCMPIETSLSTIANDDEQEFGTSTLGDDARRVNGLATVPLSEQEEDKDMFFVTIVGLTIDGDYIAIAPQLLLIDTGSTFTSLTPTIYTLVIQKFQNLLPGRKKVISQAMCFRACDCGPVEDIPKLAYHFDNGVHMELVPHNLFDRQGDFWCSTIRKGETNILGLAHMMNILVLLDSDNSLFGFKPNCMGYAK
ncbi:aspartyl protease UND-like [Selaginella moellendorffii]|uniref:aspartyl protease UND-like n=1 Tax=Selaginella moellendorffii TaxID=88036 RepID=UPI000D1C2EC8|nr:aspartyl protease UND-like [Selaginella moellendorffii]|eukprot:XP_024539102.1 aspartyl protease UND-like [Selaginella moellendorffii]